MNLQDLKTRKEIGLVLNAMGLTGDGVEIGVAFGENAEAILQSSLLSRLYLVDSWNYVPGQDSRGYGDDIKNWDGCFNHCVNRLSRFGSRAVIKRMNSESASQEVPDGSLDFVYIDGNHMSPFVDMDISLWFPKVKIGGVIGGHDYYNLDTQRYRCDVKSAVDSAFSNQMESMVILPAEDSSWYIVKTDKGINESR